MTKEQQEFQKGFQLATDILDTGYAVEMGRDYVQNVEVEIENLTTSINQYLGKQNPTPSLGGYVAEEWHTGTFNINAALHGFQNRAETLGSKDFASKDIIIKIKDLEKGYGLKYYATADGSVKAQAENWIQKFHKYNSKHNGTKSFVEYCDERSDSESLKIYQSVYEGQGRLIPSDQLKEGIEWLSRKIAKESAKALTEENKKRIALLQGYKETFEKLCDRISDGKVESIPLTRDEARKIAAFLRENKKFKPEDFGLTTYDLITPDLVFQQALNAGLNAALISAVLQAAPQIYHILYRLLQEKKIKFEDIAETGKIVLSSSTEAFLRGGIASALTIFAKQGIFGEAVKGADPFAISSLTILFFETLKCSVDVARGKMSAKDMAVLVSDKAIVLCISYALGKGVQIAFPNFPVIAYMLGSVVGCIVGGVTVAIGKQWLIGLSIDCGYAYFGLIEQDYKYPEEYLLDMGIELSGCELCEPDTIEPELCEPDIVEPDTCEPETVELKILRRGVIGVCKVGYTYG